MTDPSPEQTSSGVEKFDFSAFPPDTLFHDRRSGQERRDAVSAPRPPSERRRKDRRRRIDPTTFEKQYTLDELEFMNAMQQFKVQTGRPFPTHGEVLKVASSLGYRQMAPPDARPPDVNGRHPDPAPDVPTRPGP